MITETQLEQLQVGDRLEYQGIQWRIADRSHYTDPNGYETQEWLIQSGTKKDYYLLREVDPDQGQQITWYLAEELDNPRITEPGSSRDLLARLPEAIRANQTPYPELQLFNRIYQFESQTEGEYVSEGVRETRITWDYWDEAHLWNLALEAWSNRIVVYSTRTVQLSDFSLVRGDSFLSATPLWQEAEKRKEKRSVQLIIAWAVTIIGFFLMVSGI